MRLTPEQRLALIDHINALVQVDFERLVFALDAPRSVVPSNFAAQGDRASALLAWVDSPTGCGLEPLLKSLGAIAPLPDKVSSKPSTMSTNRQLPSPAPSSLESVMSKQSPSPSLIPSSSEADVLIVTVTKVESRAVMQVFEQAVGHKPTPEAVGDRVYFNLGVVNDARIFLTQSEMGSGGVDASLLTVSKGIEALSPVAVIMVGIAFGINGQKQSIGDVLVSEQLRLYELQRMGTQDGKPNIILRGDKPHASPWLINLFKSADLMWEGAKVRFGTVLTGEKLVDNLDFRDQIHRFESEAIGGEMEGAGLYVACHDQKVDWILVKGICDWADGNKGQDKVARQNTAAQNAAGFVLETLQFAQIDWQRRRPYMRPSPNNPGDQPGIGDSQGILPINRPSVDVQSSRPTSVPYVRGGQLRLDGPQRERLRSVLEIAFPTPESLNRMLSAELDLSLNTVTGTGAYPNQLFDLVVWINAQGRVEDLIRGASKINSGSPELQELALEWLEQE